MFIAGEREFPSQSIDAARRCDQSVANRFENTVGKALRELALHLFDLPSRPSRSRAAIADTIDRLLAEQSAPTADVLIGDFNITRGSATLRRIAGGFRHAYDMAGHGYGVSYHHWSPFFHIDHVLLAPHQPVARYDLVDPGLGQHFIQMTWLPRRAVTAR